MKYLAPALASLGIIAATSAFAAPVNGTGLITSNIIFGTGGNADGSWTGENANGIEVALRGKLRFDAGGNPQNVFNYDGIDTYTFDPTLSANPTNRSLFNFEFSVNSDVTGALGRNLDDITWNLTVDNNATAAIFNVFNADPINTIFADHSFGNNSTADASGAEAPFPNIFTYASLVSSNNVAQNSQNLGFNLFSFDPDAEGIYTFSLTGSDGTGVLASTSINIIVETPAVVPLPATLPLLLGSVAAFGTLRKRRKS